MPSPHGWSAAERAVSGAPNGSTARTRGQGPGLVALTLGTFEGDDDLRSDDARQRSGETSPGRLCGHHQRAPGRVRDQGPCRPAPGRATKVVSQPARAAAPTENQTHSSPEGVNPEGRALDGGCVGRVLIGCAWRRRPRRRGPGRFSNGPGPSPCSRLRETMVRVDRRDSPGTRHPEAAITTGRTCLTHAPRAASSPSVRPGRGAGHPQGQRSCRGRPPTGPWSSAGAPPPGIPSRGRSRASGVVRLTDRGGSCQTSNVHG